VTSGQTFNDATRQAYESVAEQYAENVTPASEKPFDVEILERFAARLGGQGPVWDLGCGPGDVTRLLHGMGVNVVGVDLSTEMLNQARRLHPGPRFEEGELFGLAAEDASLAGIVSFYALIHVDPTLLSGVLREFHRALVPGGLLLFAVHAGEGITHLEQWFDRPVSLTTFFFRPAQLTASAQEGGLLVEDLIVRPPYPDIEYPSERLYVLARKPP